MPGIHVVTDNAADLPPALLAESGVTVVPLDVRIGDLPADETRGYSAERFWEVIEATSALAETSAPSPGAFRAAFLDAAQAGAEGIVCVTISSRISATYQAAVAGAADLPSSVPVEVVDSRSVTLAEGFLVLEAARRAGRGDGLESVASAVRDRVGKLKVVGALDTLDTLRRGGRIGSAPAFFGSLLSIKPIVEMRDGVVEGESRQRTRARSLRYLADVAAAQGPLARLAVAHAAARDLGDFLALLHDARPDDEILVAHLGPVIGAHTGPGTIGLCMELA
ncbi:MAG: DegV family protein [Actinomycetota bacterium]|nr:DegV family protein [Actinomycetota bacterium]